MPHAAFVDSLERAVLYELAAFAVQRNIIQSYSVPDCGAAPARATGRTSGRRS